MSAAAALREHALALLDLCQSPDVPRLRALLAQPLAAPTRTPHEALLATLRALHATGELDVAPAVGIVAILDRHEIDAAGAL